MRLRRNHDEEKVKSSSGDGDGKKRKEGYLLGKGVSVLIVSHGVEQPLPRPTNSLWPDMPASVNHEPNHPLTTIIIIIFHLIFIYF